MAVNTAAESAPDVAVSVYVPAAAPNSHESTVATPFASVSLTAPPTVDPADPANVTCAPATALPVASTRRTLGAGVIVVPTRAESVDAVTGVIDAAAPAVPLAVNTIGLADTPAATTSADNRFTPTTVPSRHPVAVATPLALVVAPGVATVPLPAITLNTTDTPGTGFANLSRTTTAGDVATSAPAAAV